MLKHGSALGLGGLSGLLLVLSLPKPDLYPLAWIALVPLLFAIARAVTLKTAVLTSYVAGFVFFAGTFYWFTSTMLVYGGIDKISAIGVGLGFALVYALHFVLVAIPLWLAIRRWGPVGVFVAAPAWVAVELLRAHWLSGFPWMLSGYALVPLSGLLQIVTVTGIYGLSFVATAVNSALAYGMATKSRSWLVGTPVVAIVLSLLPILPAPADPSGAALKVRIVQTNISLDQPWDNATSSQQLLDELETLSTTPPGTTDLIVWPETPAPFYLRQDPQFLGRIQRIARNSNANVLMGYIDQAADGPTNSAGMIDPTGKQVSRFDKMHLVPFGEYVPLKGLLVFADSLTRQVGDFKPGTEFTLSSVGGHSVSTIICYESIFPDLVREFVRRGSEMIVLITNDGWFGESSAPFQHLRMGVVRAVENRRYEVRTANTGISAIIDPYGRIERQSPLGRRLVLDGKAYFRTDQTFYTRYGDLFAYLNAALTLVIAGAALRRTNVRRSH